MHYGIGAFPGAGEQNRDARPSRGEVEQQIAQGGGSDSARDKVARDDRRRKSLRLVGRRVAMKQLQEEIGIGRVAAASSSKGG